MSNSNNYVAIMAGGIGSRFLPPSRQNRPKQFLDVLGTGETLLKATFDRFAKIVPTENIYIVTNAQYIDLVQESIPGITEEQILAEPDRRNTAPCIAYFSYKILNKNPRANLVVAPSDHLIVDNMAFAADINKGLQYTQNHDELLTLGIRPSRPDTNYGYIQFLENELEKDIYRVKTFTEKPNAELAQHFLESGDYLWNSGIFIWSARSIVSALRAHLQEIADVFESGKDFFNTPSETFFIEQAYSQCTNISIDYGVMEKAENVAVIPSDFGWCDLGTWNSLWDQKEKDTHQNALISKNVLMYQSSDNIVAANPDKLVVLQGLEGYCIVDTDDVLMICRKDSEGMIKDFMRDLKSQQQDKYL